MIKQARGIPMATDIALAVAILARLNRRVPSQLRLFLLTFAIVDDVGSISVIAIYYIASLSLPAMELAIADSGTDAKNALTGFRSTLAYCIARCYFWAATKYEPPA